VATHQAEITTGSELNGARRHHEYRLGQAAACSHQKQVTALLEPVPGRITEVEGWKAAAGALEAYQSRWNIGTGTRSILTCRTPNNWPISTMWRQRSEVLGSSITQIQPPGHPMGTCWLIAQQKGQPPHRQSDENRPDTRSSSRAVMAGAG
jgi:hypothetical protein